MRRLAALLRDRSQCSATRRRVYGVPIDKKRDAVYRKGVLRGAFGLSRRHGLGVNDSPGLLGGGLDGAGSRCLGVFVARRLW
jgi:hypothetical protein